jgi:class 3 adenylate cyclase
MAIKLAIKIYHIVSTFSYPGVEKKLVVRIGIATGPVVAGIIGKKKYSYDCK